MESTSDSEKKPHALPTEIASTVDFRIEAPEEYSGTEDASLKRKIDCWLMPVMCITYALQSIDKTTLSYAGVFGIQQDAKLVGQDFSWLGSLFYLGYLAWEWPACVLIQKLPVAKVTAMTVFLWGAVLMTHAAAHDFAGLAAARFLLGVFESGIQPCTMVIFAMFYKRQEQPLRIGTWIGCAGLGYVVAGIASFGIGQISGPFPSWRYMFLIWGAVTVVWGLAVLAILPDHPSKTRWLSAGERTSVLKRVEENQTGIENKSWDRGQFLETFRDAKTWLLFIFAVASNAPNGGLTTFQGLIIRGLGFSVLNTTLIQMPSGAVQFVICVGATYIASRFTNARLPTMLACLAPFLAGTIGIWVLPQSNAWGRLVCLWLCFSYTATWSLSMAVVIANTAGHTKKTTSAAVLLIGYCIGNFCGPQFFLKSQAPHYQLGLIMMLCCCVIQIIAICGIWMLLWRRNKSRAGYRIESQRNGTVLALHDQTDLENKNFQYVY